MGTPFTIAKPTLVIQVGVQQYPVQLSQFSQSVRALQESGRFLALKGWCRREVNLQRFFLSHCLESKMVPSKNVDLAIYSVCGINQIPPWLSAMPLKVKIISISFCGLIIHCLIFVIIVI